MAPGLLAHFGYFSPYSRPLCPHPFPPSPASGSCPLRVLWGRGCGVRRGKLASAAALLQLQCHVGMLPQ